MWYVESLCPVSTPVSVLLRRPEVAGDAAERVQAIQFFARCSKDVPPNAKTPYSAVYLADATGELMPLDQSIDEEGWTIADWIVDPTRVDAPFTLTGLPYLETWRDVTWAPDATRRSYFLPPGHDFLDTLVSTAVQVYVGGALADPATYTAVHRGQNNPTFGPQASVVDAAIGVQLAAPPSADVLIRWVERSLVGLEDPVVGRCRVVVDSSYQPETPRTFDLGPTNTKVWRKETTVGGDPKASRQTNAVELPRLPEGYLWEVWRRTRRDGGARSGSGTRYPRDGRRFVPLCRLAQPVVGKSLYHWRDLGLAYERRHVTMFRAYDPATGARGPFSRDAIRWYPQRDACWTEGSPNPRGT
jgi:hypothetical protein